MNFIIRIFFVSLILQSSCTTDPQDEYIIDDILFNTEGYRPTDFKSITPDKLQRVWSESFDNNTRNWILKNDLTTFKAEIKNSQYQINNYSSDFAYSSSTSSGINLQRDFQVQTSMKFNNSNSSGLMLRSGDDFILLMANNSGKVFVTHYKNGAYNDVKVIDNFSEPQNTSSFNTYTIRKIGKKYYFYINNLYSGIEYDDQQIGLELGFFVNPNTGLTADEILLDYINI